LSFNAYAVEDTRTHIAVVDSGININSFVLPYLCKDGQYDLTGFGLQDVHGHGSNVAGLIAKHIDKRTHCLTIIKWFHLNADPSTIKQIITAYTTLLLRIKPKYTNLSLSGSGSSVEERTTFARLLNAGAYIIVAAGNNAYNLGYSCVAFPACYGFKQKGFRVVTTNHPLANKFGPVNAVANGVRQCAMGVCMTGTSQAAANYTGMLASGKVK